MPSVGIYSGGMFDYNDRFEDERDTEDAEPCDDGEHEHDYAGYELQREGNLVIGTCKHCGREFVEEEIETEEEDAA